MCESSARKTISKIVRRLLQEQQELRKQKELREQQMQQKLRQQEPLEQKEIKLHLKTVPAKDVQQQLSNKQVEGVMQEVNQQLDNGQYKTMEGELVECQDILEQFTACNCRIHEDLNNIRRILSELRERIVELARL